MFLNDLLQRRRIAAAVPRALRVDDGDRSAFTNSQAIGLRAKYAAALGQSELLQPPLEILPRHQGALALAALRVRLVAAQENVAPRAADAYGVRNRLLPLEVFAHN